MQNPQTQEQIQIINELEQFIFGKIRHSFTSPVRFHESIRMAPEEKLKNAIYSLHDEGLFKESEEAKNKRLCKDTVKAFFADKDGNDLVEKLDFEYLPTHYHEIIQGIRSYHDAVEAINLDKAENLYSTLLRSYSQHFDCYNLKNLPDILQTPIHHIQNSYLSQEPDRIKEKAYIKFVNIFIEKYENDHEQLWDELNFSKQDKKILQELSQLLEQLKHPFKNKFEQRQHRSKIRINNKISQILFNKIIKHLNGSAETHVRATLKKIYISKEKMYKKQNINIDMLLRSKLNRYQIKILNKNQKIKVISKIGSHCTPALKAKLIAKMNIKNKALKEFIKDEHKKARQQLKFKKLLQKKIVQNLINPAKPIYDPGLFNPSTSIHDLNSLEDLKTKIVRNKSNKKQRSLKVKKDSNTNPRRNFIGDTNRILKENKALYESLKSLLNRTSSN